MPVYRLQFALTLVLAVASALPPGPVRLLIFGLLSGAPIAFSLRDTWGLDALLVPPLVSLLIWPLGMWVPAGTFALIPLALGLFELGRGRTLTLQLGRPDLVGAAAILLITVPIGIIAGANGLHGGTYVAHGWVSHDSLYLYALAQEAIERGGWPPVNPWLSGAPNVYASLLHVGLGALSKQGGGPAAIVLPPLLAIYLIYAPALWIRECARSGSALVALIGGIACIAARLDLFVYVQSQSVIFGALAVLLWLTDDDPTPARRLAVVATVVVLSYAHPILGLVGFLLIFRRRFPWVPPVGAVLLGLGSMVFALTRSDPTEQWFVSFNAPRFLDLAALCLLPALAGHRWQVEAAWTAMLVALLHPTDLAGGVHSLVDEPPRVADAAELDVFERIRRETPADARFATMVPDFLLPALTGRSQWIVENRGTYGRSGLEPADFDARAADETEFWTRPLATWPESLDAHGCTHLLLRLGPNRLSTEALEAQFDPGAMRVVFDEGDWAVLERLRPAPE